MDAISAVDEYYPKINLVESGIKDTFVSGQIERIEYYNLQGMRLAEPAQGVSIRRTVYTDGKIVTDKVVK